MDRQVKGSVRKLSSLNKLYTRLETATVGRYPLVVRLGSKSRVTIFTLFSLGYKKIYLKIDADC